MLLRKSSGRETNTFPVLHCVYKTNLRRSGPMHFKPVLCKGQLILFLKEKHKESAVEEWVVLVIFVLKN